MISQDDLRVVIASSIHRDGILQIAERVFNKDEPVRVALNVQWDTVKDDWEKLVDACLEKGHSHVAVNKENEVVGIRLSRIIELTQLSPNESFNNFLAPGGACQMEDQLTKDWATVLVDENGQTCKKLLQFLALSVHPDYGGRGLAVKMCEENMKLAKRLACEYCSEVASNWISQRVFEKLGFKTVNSIVFDDFYNSNGERQIEMQDKRNVAAKWFVKKL
jgi:ribosomal protein S18 acetylase RimI-like enzyme